MILLSTGWSLYYFIVVSMNLEELIELVRQRPEIYL